MTTTVVLTDFFSWTILAHLVRALIMFNIVHTVLKDKYNTFVTLIAVVFSGLLCSYLGLEVSPFKSDIVLYFAYIVFELVVVLLVCKGSLLDKIFTVLGGIITAILSSIVQAPIFLSLGFPKSAFLSAETPFVLFLSSILFNYSFSFVVVLIIKLIQNHSPKRKKANKHSSKSYIFLIFPIMHIFYFLGFIRVSYLLDSTMDFNQAHSSALKTTMIFTFICFVADMFIFLLVEYIDKLEQKNIENEKQILTNAMTYQQTVMLNDAKKEFRKIKHDINNLLTTAIGFIEIDKSEQALDLLKNTENSVFEIGGQSVCTNDSINTITHIKEQKAKENDVDFSIEVEENFAVTVDEYDLCRLLHNLMDNSINAAAESTDDHKSKVNIVIDKNFISIVTENSYLKGKRRVVREDHGYGKTIIREIVKKYNGTYSLSVQDNIYRTETVIDNIKCE